MYDKGLSTVIDPSARDAFGHSIPAETKATMQRLRRLQSRTNLNESVDRNLFQAMLHLNRIADRMHLPENIRENAASIYRKALEADLVRGRSILGTVAASVYAACRASETPRTLKEVVETSGLPRKAVARHYRLLINSLEMKMPYPDTFRYLSKNSNKVNVSMRTQNLARQLLVEADEMKIIPGKDPNGIAAAALYLACVINNEKCTQEELARSANVTEVGLRNRIRELRARLRPEAPARAHWTRAERPPLAAS
jgi:transcription initiation factor TFIIB